MLTLSLAKCINATKNGAFAIKDLDLSGLYLMKMYYF